MQKSFSWDKITIQKAFKGLAIAGVGAVLTFLEEAIPGINFGQYTPLAMMLNSAIFNALREYIKGVK